MLTQKELLEKRQMLSENDARMAAVFKALSDVNRYRIFRILVEQPKLTVSNISQILNISLPLASQHIKILVHNNLLQKERKGKTIIPKLKDDNPFVKATIKSIKYSLKF